MLNYIYLGLFLLSCSPAIILLLGLLTIRKIEKRAIEMPHHHGILEAAESMKPVLDRFERIMVNRMLFVGASCILVAAIPFDWALLSGIGLNFVGFALTRGDRDEIDLVVAYIKYIYAEEDDFSDFGY